MIWFKLQHNQRDDQVKAEAGWGARRTVGELMSIWITIAVREEVSGLILDLSPHCITKLEIHSCLLLLSTRSRLLLSWTVWTRRCPRPLAGRQQLFCMTDALGSSLLVFLQPTSPSSPSPAQGLLLYHPPLSAHYFRMFCLHPSYLQKLLRNCGERGN